MKVDSVRMKKEIGMFIDLKYLSGTTSLRQYNYSISLINLFE